MADEDECCARQLRNKFVDSGNYSISVHQMKSYGEVSSTSSVKSGFLWIIFRAENLIADADITLQLQCLRILSV